MVTMNTAKNRIIDLTQELAALNHVTFDSTTAVLEGLYGDELSAHRVKRSWIETLEHNFLLDDQHDFEILITGEIEKGEYQVECSFLTACGRYAFWRLTNNQAPEAQYTIETAHIPNAESLYSKMLQAPDLSKKSATEIFELDEGFPAVTSERTSTFHWLKSLLKNR